MSITSYERVGRALNLLCEGLYPFIEQEMKAEYGDRWIEIAAATTPASYLHNRTDVSALLILVWEKWNDVFKRTLG